MSSIAILGYALITCNLLSQAPISANGASYGIDHAKIGNIVKVDFTSSGFLMPSSTRALNLFAHPDVMFSLLTDVATRLVNKSKQLDHEFAMVVEKEFWNLLQ